MHIGLQQRDCQSEEIEHSGAAYALVRSIVGPVWHGNAFEDSCCCNCGYNGGELDALCIFELTNTPDFVGFARSKGYGGMVGYEDGGCLRVVCAFDRSHLGLADHVVRPLAKSKQGMIEYGE